MRRNFAIFASGTDRTLFSTFATSHSDFVGGPCQQPITRILARTCFLLVTQNHQEMYVMGASMHKTQRIVLIGSMIMLAVAATFATVVTAHVPNKSQCFGCEEQNKSPDRRIERNLLETVGKGESRTLWGDESIDVRAGFIELPSDDYLSYYYDEFEDYDCSLCSSDNMSELQQRLLKQRSRSIVCDDSCLLPKGNPTYGVTLCNYFDISKACRACCHVSAFKVPFFSMATFVRQMLTSFCKSYRRDPLIPPSGRKGKLFKPASTRFQAPKFIRSRDYSRWFLKNRVLNDILTPCKRHRKDSDAHTRHFVPFAGFTSNSKFKIFFFLGNFFPLFYTLLTPLQTFLRLAFDINR